MKYTACLERAVGAVNTARSRIARRLADPDESDIKRARLLSREAPHANARMRRIVVFSAAGISLALSAYGVWYHFDTVAYENALKEAAQTVQRQSDAAARLQQSEMRATAIDTRLKHSPLGSATRMMIGISQDIERVRHDAIVGVPVSLTRESYVDIRPYLERAKTHLDAAAPVLDHLATTLSGVEKLLDANLRLQNMQASPAYQLARSRFAYAATMERDAARAIDEADGKGVAAAVNCVERLDAATDAAQIAALDAARERATETLAGFTLLALPDAERATVDAQAAAVTEAIDNMDAVAAQRRVMRLAGLLAFATTPVTVRMVLENGQPSEFARAYTPMGNGASTRTNYFVLAEAVDASGAAVPMPGISADTGDEALDHEFAVQISRQQYFELMDQIRIAALSNLGEKPANSITVRYTAAASNQPDLLFK
ncbi:DUF6384 family protein [Noviherbaspirillum pedocola]|uniref:Uncharacterized protein n=1 Tax=Noviherbaspirillum pedocola TaxID=2801341 RepID=A0A934W743_9BURK|nr:DUF6384 family protein [Noviherbaspirillum pedocola]MBK4735925.1 hypothetical protein [Noviherbaspirillum pedocola]